MFCFLCGILGHHVGKCHQIPSDLGRERYNTRIRGGTVAKMNYPVSKFDVHYLHRGPSSDHFQLIPVLNAGVSRQLEKEGLLARVTLIWSSWQQWIPSIKGIVHHTSTNSYYECGAHNFLGA